MLRGWLRRETIFLRIDTIDAKLITFESFTKPHKKIITNVHRKSGKINVWPSVENIPTSSYRKIEEQVEMLKIRGKHSTQSKKYKKHSHKQNDHNSSEDEWVEAELIEKRKNCSPKRKRYNCISSESSHEKTISKGKSQSKSSDSSSSDSDSNDRKETKTNKKNKRNSSSFLNEYVSKRKMNTSTDRQCSSTKTSNNEQTMNKREDWMNLSDNFPAFSKDKGNKIRNEEEKTKQKELEQYKCSRELNPYWKNGGDGLPKFQKPRDDDADNGSSRRSMSRKSQTQSGWRISKSEVPESSSAKIDTNRANGSITYSSRMNSNTGKKEEKSRVDQSQANEPLGEQKLNLLAGKLLKAEIMGDEKLVKELKDKLESGRKALAEAKIDDMEVLLTQTSQGRCKPLTLQHEYEEDSRSKKHRKKAMETHKDQQRVRYFPDDDKYSLKQMFENEKFSSSNYQDSEFMKSAANIRKNDDLDDFFADNIRNKKSDSKIDESNRSKAINEHKKMSDSLDNCSKCIQSAAMQKHLIVSMGEYIYLGLPAHEPLLEGHCLLIPIRHVSSVTQLDENEWNEIKDFRKALIRLFQSKEQEPIFFEIATGFHRFPHMVLECVPLSKEAGDMAPIYFKKAIEESEYEWAHNKKLVSLKGRDVRKAIPKELPYFSVSFVMDEGFAHIIEDERLFPKNFAQEIIGGILDLHHSKWRKPLRQPFDLQSKRVLNFSKEWKEFDCTVTGIGV